MISELYRAQVELLLNVMPVVARQSCFALKGGTAINLFVNEFPRLSVDIDLTYLPIQSRLESLNGIHEALSKIAKEISSTLGNLYPHIKVRATRSGAQQATKLFVSNGRVKIKIEPNLVLRGQVYQTEIRPLSASVSQMFQMELEAPVMSIPDLYGGKICAALDRQHPRDLFDVRDMFENGGLTSEIRKAFVVYLASHDKPIHELLNPKLKDFASIFNSEFKGMTFKPVSYDELLGVREKLVKTINAELSNAERSFLLSIKEGEPQWQLLELQAIENLPGLRWKLANINKLEKGKHLNLISKLRETLGL